MIKLRLLRWGDCLGLSGWAQCPCRKEAERSESERAVMMDVEAGTMHLVGGVHERTMQAASRRWKGQGNEFSLGASGRNSSDFSPVRLISDFGQNYKRINLCCFKPPSVWIFVTAATGN